MVTKSPDATQILTRNADALIKASSSNNPELVNYILSLGKIDVNQPSSKSSKLAIHKAVKSGNAEIVQILISNGAKVDSLDKSNKSPMDIACKASDLPIATILNEKGVAFTENHMRYASSSDNSDLIKLMISKGLDVNKPFGDNTYPIHEACTAKTNQVMDVILSNGGNIEQTNKDNETPLLIACKNSSPVALLLISKGANVNIVDSKNNTPLHIAAKNNQSTVIKSLISKGCNPDAKNKDQHTPFEIGVSEGNALVVSALEDITKYDLKNPSILIGASKNGYLYIVDKMINGGVDVNATVNGTTALHMAVENGHLNIIVRLKEANANFLAKDKNNKTPIELGAEETLQNLPFNITDFAKRPSKCCLLI